MTKSDIVKELAKREEIKLKIAEEVVNTIFDSMIEALKSGDKIEIRGFGSIKVKEYDSYEGRNPRTGEVISIPKKKLPFFKLGKEMKERLNS